jgi:hypothetical protein
MRDLGSNQHLTALVGNKKVRLPPVFFSPKCIKYFLAIALKIYLVLIRPIVSHIYRTLLLNL